MEMASSEVEMSSCQTFNCVLSRPHERCTRGDNNTNKKKNNNNNNNVRNIHVAFEKNLNVFVRDHLDNCSVSVGDDSTKTVPDSSSNNKSSVSDHRTSKTEESRLDVPSSSSIGSEPDPNSGQPENPSRKETRAASSLVQIWEARTTQQPPSSNQNQNQSQIDSRTSSTGSNLLENSESLNEESELIQTIEEGNHEEEKEEIECDSQFVPPSLDSGDKEREGVRVMDIIRKLSNESETITNNDNGSSGNENGKEVQTTEARYFPQVACSPRIRGRQAFADLLVQMIRDREKELAAVLDRHSVSKFTHRGRIQSTLRIRCYERCIAIQDRHRCKPSSAGSDLNRSPRGSGVMHLLREKYKTNSENIDTGASSSTVSSRGRILDKDPRNATEKKILQETIEKSDLKEIKEVISAAENVKKPVLSEIAENKNALKKYSGETIKKETAERRETNEKAAAKERLEGRGERRELTKEKAIAKENVEGNALVGIAEKVNLWNSEEKMNRRKGMEKGKVEKNDVLEEATRRMVNVESAERSITTSKETMARCEFVEKVVRRKNKEDCVSVETKSKEINPQEATAQAEEKVLQETTVNTVLRKPIEKESREGRDERRELEESVEGNTLMGIAEKVNMWNSKENKNRRRVMEKGKGNKTEGKDNKETNEVLKEASRRISNVETAERSIASSKETVVEKEEIMDKREISRETTRSEPAEKHKIKKEEEFASVEAKCKEIIEDKIMSPQEKKSTNQVEEKLIMRNLNDKNDIKESEDEEIKKVEHEEKEENVKEVAAVEFVNDWEENEMEEEEEDEYYREYDHYNGENMDDWIHDISRPRSYWEDLRKERYLEVLNAESEKKDICNLIERRTVSNFLTSDLRQKIDNLMITRVHGHVGVPIDQVEEELDKEEEEEEEEEEWEVEYSARNQEDNETEEEEAEKTNLEAVSDVCSQSSERSTMLMSWSFRDQEIDKDQEPTTSLSIPEPSVPTNQSTQETLVISELRGQMEQLQREMLELRNTVKSCIDMQLHFQKSVTQDLSRSEQLVETKPDPLKRKCCVCSEMPVDSLLYRCGHMCTCLKCAHELQWSSKKCPICMAPIVDVVRAFLDS